MAKKRRKNVTGKLLLLTSRILGETGDFFEKVFMESYIPYRERKWHRIQKQQLKRDLARLRRNGYLEKVIEKGEAKYKLTLAGEKKVVETYPLLKLAKKGWDGRWRIVIFDIKESKRYRRRWLRDFLESLGMGMMQRSVWVTPYNLGDILKGNLEKRGFKEGVIVLEAEQIFGEDEQNLAEKIWELDKLGGEYQEWLDEAQNMDFPKEDLVNWYLDILEDDPVLPDELLPDFWWGKEARKKFIKLLRVKK